MSTTGPVSEQWRFQPWPGPRGTPRQWKDDVTETRTALSRIARPLLMALGLILVIGFAGIGAANLVTAEADSGVWSENSLNNRTCHDWHLTQLLRYHRQAVREL